MKNNWYKKVLLSYIPAIYVSIAIIVFIAIFMVVEISMKEAEQTKRYTTEYIVQSLETQLSTIERRVIEELRLGDALYQYFDANTSSSSSGVINFEANKILRQLTSEFPIIHSAYLYRIKDQKVLTLGSYGTVHEFPDQAYIFNELSNQHQTRSWSTPRFFSDGIGLEPSKAEVISFAQITQIPMGNEGIIVINVSVADLLNMVESIVDPEHTYMEIETLDGALIFSTNENEKKRITTSIQSDYLQWHFSSGLQTTFSIHALKMISRSWLTFGALVIITILVYTVYITKRNYRPIEKIVKQIQSYQDHAAVQKSLATDEFSFIQKAIERLTDENMQYEAQVQQTMQQTKAQTFIELLEHNDNSKVDAWYPTIERLSLPRHFAYAVVTVIEIDQYKRFEEKYKIPFDQGLIKFAISNVLHEYMNQYGVHWSEWTRRDRMPVIHIFEQEQDMNEWFHSLEKFRVWVAVNMGISVTIGVGLEKQDWKNIYESYYEAGEALQYKLSYGNNKTIHYQQTAQKQSLNIHSYYQEINALVHDFRLGNEQWTERIKELFSKWKNEYFTNDENIHLLQYFKSLLNQLLEKMPQELKKEWDHSIEELWDKQLQKESIADIVPPLLDRINELYSAYLSFIAAKDSKNIVYSIRDYIDQNYSNPELSLGLISEQFDLNSKYVSQMFKEQLAVNFADYVLDLRINYAKKLLLTTNDSINEIASKVGYEIPLSFGRAFKKHVGVSPSDYRKNMVAQTSD